MVVGEFTTEVDVLVIGGGPGGYVAAIRAAQLGKNVTLVDKADLGGVCLNRGCIPSKALISTSELLNRIKDAGNVGIEVDGVSVDMNKVQEWKQGVVEKLTGGVGSLLKANKVTVVKGEALFVGKDEVRVQMGYESERYKFKDCIVATGSQPVELKNLPFDGEKIVSSTEALNFNEVPQRLVVVGGGYIGLELGTAYSKFGSEVTILEGTDQVLPGNEKSLVRMVTRNLKKQGVTVHTKTMVQKAEVQGDEVVVTAEVKGETQQFTADKVLVAVGRKPNTADLGLEDIGVKMDDKGFVEVNKKLETSVPHLYAIGDIAGQPLLAHKASYEGKVAAEVIAGQPSEIDYMAIPFVIFSDPEIATVGLSAQEAKDQGYQVKTGKFPFQANGRALSMEAADGFVQVVADEESKLVLGVQIVGPEASNLVSEATLAIEMGATVEDLELTIHAHPTLPESLMEAAESVMGHAIHTVNK